MSEQQYQAEVMDELEAEEITRSAFREKLWGLWRAVLNHFTSYLTETPREKRRAAQLGLAIKFLADNNVVIDAKSFDATADGLKRLEGLQLPFVTKQ